MPVGTNRALAQIIAFLLLASCKSSNADLPVTTAYGYDEMLEKSDYVLLGIISDGADCRDPIFPSFGPSEWVPCSQSVRVEGYYKGADKQTFQMDYFAYNQAFSGERQLAILPGKYILFVKKQGSKIRLTNDLGMAAVPAGEVIFRDLPHGDRGDSLIDSLLDLSHGPSEKEYVNQLSMALLLGAQRPGTLQVLRKAYEELRKRPDQSLRGVFCLQILSFYFPGYHSCAFSARVRRELSLSQIRPQGEIDKLVAERLLEIRIEQEALKKDEQQWLTVQAKRFGSISKAEEYKRNLASGGFPFGALD